MPDDDAPEPEAAMAELRARAETLERQIEAIKLETDARLVRAEFKAEAVRAGIVDLDGLKLLDLSAARLNERGEVDNASAILVQLKRAKPWLFGAASSSHPAAPPAAQPPRQKLATEMTDAEYRAARSELLRRRS